MILEQDKSWFFVRTTIPWNSHDREYLQDKYNHLEIRINLLDGIIFRDLFTLSWPDLVNRIIGQDGNGNFKRVGFHGLVTRLTDALALLNELSVYDGNYLDYFMQPNPAITAILTDLGGCNIYLPNIEAPSLNMVEAAHNLIHDSVAFQYTYREVYSMPKHSVPKHALTVLHAAIDTGVIVQMCNNRCCTLNGETSTCAIVTSSSYCAVSPDGTPVAGSNPCPTCDN